MARGEDKGYEVEGKGELDILLDRIVFSSLTLLNLILSSLILLNLMQD